MKGSRNPVWMYLRSGLVVPAITALLLGACSNGDVGGGSSSDGTDPGDTSRPTVTVTPKTVSVLMGATQQFGVTVTGTSNTAVTWSVSENAGGNISASGLYTAPAVIGTYHVTVTLQVDAGVSDTATVTVTEPVVTVVISPTARTLETNAQYQFSATVGGTANTAVTWSVDEAPNGGSVTQGGLYTAPGTAGTYHVRATAQAAPTVSDVATVTVVTSGTYIAPGDVSGDVIVAVDSHQTRPISPFIYGLNVAELSGSRDSQVWGANLPKFTLNRYGGNNTTPLNWETGYTNAGADWSFMNYDYPLWTVGAAPGPGNAIAPRIDFAHAHDAGAVITVPILGFVARDTAGTMPIPAAPDAVTPATPDPQHWLQVRAQNPAGATATPDPADGYVYSDDFAKWIDTRYPGAATAAIKTVQFQLDNEPDIWHDTHAEIRGIFNGRHIPTGFQELVDMTIGHATAVKSVIPEAVVWGGAIAGFDGLVQLHYPGDAPDAGHDRAPTGYTYYVDYFLEKLKQESDTVGKRLIDVFDMHWYVQNGATTNAWIDQGDAASAGSPVTAREQAPRSLWDPYYIENSWVTSAIPSADAQNCRNGNCPIYIIPRLQARIDRYFPGTRLAIGEYWYGRGGDISAAITNADVLGIFGKFGVYAATMWPNAGDGIWAYQDSTCTTETCVSTRAYRCALMAIDIYRNYDGANSKFGDTHIGTTIADPAFTSPATQNERVTAYASMDAGNPDRVVIVAINKAATVLNTGLKIIHTRAFTTAEVWQVTGTNGGLGGCTVPARQADIALPVTNAFNVSLPAQSVTVIVLRP